LVLGAQLSALRVAWRRPELRMASAALAGATLALLIEWSTDVTVRYAPVAASMAVIFGATAALYRRARPGRRRAVVVRAPESPRLAASTT
jgi:hypothetical protein